MFSKNHLIVLTLVLIIVSCKTDDNEIMNNAPLVTAQTFSIDENGVEDDIMGKVIATDTDGDNLTFSLSSNPDGLFKINDDGEISLTSNSVLDYETTTSYVITVEVSDGSLSATADVTINVLDIVEQLPFITTWITSVPNETITIPTNTNLTYNYSVDWGDGTTSHNQTTDAIHTYASTGTHEIAITGDFPAILFQGIGDKDKIQSIKQWGSIEWQSMNRAFFGCSQLIYEATDVPDLTSVTDMFSMFFLATSFNGNLNNWDVGNVTITRSMFWGATSFNGDISDWDVSSVTNMASMFLGDSSFNQDLSDWDVSNVTNMAFMFNNATLFNGDISKWDVSSVAIMEGMFQEATSFNGDLSDWDVSGVALMQRMFSFATSFNGDISDWDVNMVSNMDRMFEEAISFNQDLSGWNTENVSFCSFFATGSGLTASQLPTQGTCF